VVDYLDEAHAYVCADFNYLQSRWYVATSAGVGLYAISVEMTAVRHVLWKSVSADLYTPLEQASLPDFWARGRNFEASGTTSHWALTGSNYGLNIQLYPMPDASSVSGLAVIGNATPQTLSASASPLPRHLLPLVPVYAALLAWQDLGIQAEADKMGALYKARSGRWKIVAVDMSPDETEVNTLGDDLSRRPLDLIRSTQDSWTPW
jgi:hypothetical protein